MARRLKTIAKELDENTALSVELVDGYYSGDRKLAGTRLRSPGKDYVGNRLIVKDEEGDTLIDHNAAETYRQNWEVELKVSAIYRSLGLNDLADKASNLSR